MGILCILFNRDLPLGVSFDAIMALAKALDTSPAAFFQFDREESDEKMLRKKIESLVNKSSSQQLQQVF